jgi:hypothetical protein
MVDRKTQLSDHLVHAGAGTALTVAYLGALIPGFIPVLALTALVAAALVAPLLILGFAAMLAAAPFYLMSRVRRRARRRRHRGEKPPAVIPRQTPERGIKLPPVGLASPAKNRPAHRPGDPLGQGRARRAPRPRKAPARASNSIGGFRGSRSIRTSPQRLLNSSSRPRIGPLSEERA